MKRLNRETAIAILDETDFDLVWWTFGLTDDDKPPTGCAVSMMIFDSLGRDANAFRSFFRTLWEGRESLTVEAFKIFAETTGTSQEYLQGLERGFMFRERPPGTESWGEAYNNGIEDGIMLNNLKQERR